MPNEVAETQGVGTSVGIGAGVIIFILIDRRYAKYNNINKDNKVSRIISFYLYINNI